MTQETPAAAPAAPAAPAPAAPQAAAPEAIDSLIPAAPAPAAEAKPAEAAKSAAPADPKAAEAAAAAAKAEADAKAWFYADGTPGKGDAPVWFKADKYKTIEEQAKAYPDLEKRFGAFKGAPKDGKYEFKMPDGLSVTLVEDHPLLGDFQKWAADRNLSQDGYQELLGMLAQYEAAQVPDLNAIKAQVGADADARITAVAQWAQANMKPEEYQLMREATTGVNAAAVFLVLESAIAKSKQVAMPKPGKDVIAAQPQGQEGIRVMMQKLDKNGKLQYFSDPVYRNEVDAKTRAFYESQNAA